MNPYALSRVLERSSAGVDNVNHLGRSVLCRAAAAGDIDQIKTLLAHGADPEVVDTRKGYTALVHAITNGRDSAVKLLLADPRTNVNASDPFGQNPLFHANAYLRSTAASALPSSSLSQQQSVIDMLIAAGADGEQTFFWERS